MTAVAIKEELHKVEEPMFEIEGAPVVFIRGGRIFKENRHDDLHYYDMRHGDDGDWGTPVCLEHSVWANYFGTLVTTKPIPSLEITEENKDTWLFVDLDENKELQNLILEHM